MQSGPANRSLYALALLILVVGGMVTVFKFRADSVVRAPGIVYPQAFADLVSPATFGCVTKVYKQNGDTVDEGEAILEFDATNETILRDQEQEQIKGLIQELEDHDLMRQQRVKQVELAQQAANEAAKAIDVEQARLEQAQAILKRAGPEPSQLEIKVAEEKYQYAVQTEEEMRVTYENYKTLYAMSAVTQDSLRLARLNYEKAKSQAQESGAELALLRNADIPYKFDDAQAQVRYRQAMVESAKATLESRKKEVEVLALAQDIDAAEKQLRANLERAKLEVQRLDIEINLKALRAPIAGVLHNFTVVPGQWLANRVPVGEIYDTSTLLFYAHIEQRDMHRVQPGQLARVYFDGITTSSGVDAQVLDISAVATPPQPLIGEAQQLFTNPRIPTMPRALARLKLLPPADQGSGTPPSALDAVRVGFTGQTKILVGDSRLAKALY